MTELEYIICESEANGEIDVNTRDKMLTVITEKRTRDEYAREKFKKKYHFVPDKPGSDKGTITINGEKRKIDMEKSAWMSIDGSLTPRQTATNILGEESEVYLDKNFFKLKNSKRRDAVLQHEIGHTKMHPMNGKSKYADPRAFSDKNLGVARQSTFNQLKEVFKQNGLEMGDDFRKNANEYIDDTISNKDDYKKRSKENPYRQKRDELIKHASKYKNSASSHSNEREFEADRYSANRVGAKNIKRGVKEVYKHMRNDYKKNKFVSKDMLKDFNKQADCDMKSRSKALKDKHLRNGELYK